METRKPPLTPQQARTMSLVVLVAGPLVAVLAHVFLCQPLRVVALSYIAGTVSYGWPFVVVSGMAHALPGDQHVEMVPHLCNSTVSHLDLRSG